MTAAVQQKGRAIMWASGSLKQDVSVALEAVKQDGTALQLLAEAPMWRINVYEVESRKDATSYIIL